MLWLFGNVALYCLNTTMSLHVLADTTVAGSEWYSDNTGDGGAATGQWGTGHTAAEPCGVCPVLTLTVSNHCGDPAHLGLTNGSTNNATHALSAADTNILNAHHHHHTYHYTYHHCKNYNPTHHPQQQVNLPLFSPLVIVFICNYMIYP